MITHNWTSCIRKLIVFCCPRRLSSISRSFASSQTTFALPFQDKAPLCEILAVISRISSSKQLNITMHPISAVSSVCASSGRESKVRTKSCFGHMIICRWDREALITVISEEIVTTVIGASLYLLRRSYNAFAVDKHVPVILTLHDQPSTFKLCICFSVISIQLYQASL